MRRLSFLDYVNLRESADPKTASDSKDLGAIGTKISLGDGNAFAPFEISDDPKSEHYGKNKNLAPIVRAFKQGANWGWSRDDSSGNDKPVKIGGKKLYLAGGAVRDHLLGKKARNIELATNCSPDEVYHILKQNGFEFINDKRSSGEKPAAPGPNRQESGRQYFWVDKTNKGGRPFTFGIKVNNDEYSLEVFSKTPRGHVDADPEPGTHAEDAAGRDFSLNSMYILLSNDNGPNKELNDFFGGTHHLTSGRIAAVGDMGSKLKEDPSRIMRYIRMLSSYGDPKKVPEEEKKIVAQSAEGLKKLDRNVLMDEFRKGMNKEGVDTRKYLKLFKDFGLMDYLFPGKMVDTEMPKELSELGDKHAPLAWVLRMNDPKSLEDLGLNKEELGKVSFLIKSLGMNENLDADSLMDLLSSYVSSGISGRKLREWGTKLGGVDGSVLDAFLKHAQGPRVKPHKKNEDGTESIDDAFADLVDPFTGSVDHDRVNERKKELEHSGFRKAVEYMKPL